MCQSTKIKLYSGYNRVVIYGRAPRQSRRGDAECSPSRVWAQLCTQQAGSLLPASRSAQGAQAAAGPGLGGLSSAWPLLSCLVSTKATGEGHTSWNGWHQAWKESGAWLDSVKWRPRPVNTPPGFVLVRLGRVKDQANFHFLASKGAFLSVNRMAFFSVLYS